MSQMIDNGAGVGLGIKQFINLNAHKSTDRYTNHGDYFIYKEQH